MTGPVVPPPAHDVLVPPGPPADIFPGYREWFDLYFSTLWKRPKPYNWCHKWEDHQEAKMAIELLWRSWEMAYANGDPNTMMIWLRDFAYNLMAKITEDGGTFTGCDWRATPEPRHAPSTFPLS